MAMMYQFRSGEELVARCGEGEIPISEVMLRREIQRSDKPREDIVAEMRRNLGVMREAVERGLTGDVHSISGLTGGDAAKLNAYAGGTPLLGEHAARAVAAAMAVQEVNAAMGRIVAAPTAGASGILPGTLLAQAAPRGWGDDALLAGLFTAGAIGSIIADHATIAGADGGCQAETGTAASMTAAALVELCGGSPAQSVDAAAIALKNVLGLVCDPVAGLVECPCIKRNAIGAVNAMVSADLALAGVHSIIPFDEVVEAMRLVGISLRPELRETAMGGLAATPTGRAIKQRMKEKQAKQA